MSAPYFRCVADEPPKTKGGMHGKSHTLDSSEGLVLDEFVLGKVVHIEQMTDGYYYARVGKHVFAIYHNGGNSGKWRVRLHEVEK